MNAFLKTLINMGKSGLDIAWDGTLFILRKFGTATEAALSLLSIDKDGNIDLKSIFTLNGIPAISNANTVTPVNKILPTEIADYTGTEIDNDDILDLSIDLFTAKGDDIAAGDKFSSAADTEDGILAAEKGSAFATTDVYEILTTGLNGSDVIISTFKYLGQAQIADLAALKTWLGSTGYYRLATTTDTVSGAIATIKGSAIIEGDIIYYSGSAITWTGANRENVKPFSLIKQQLPQSFTVNDTRKVDFDAQNVAKTAGIGIHFSCPVSAGVTGVSVASGETSLIRIANNVINVVVASGDDNDDVIAAAGESLGDIVPTVAVGALGTGTIIAALTQHAIDNTLAGYGASGANAERVMGATYQNTTGRELLVSVNGTVGNGNNTINGFSLKISANQQDWLTPSIHKSVEIGGANGKATVQYPVPAGWYYMVFDEMDDGASTLENWIEYR